MGLDIKEHGRDDTKPVDNPKNDLPTAEDDYFTKNTPEQIAQINADLSEAVRHSLPDADRRGFDGEEGLKFLHGLGIDYLPRWRHPKSPNSIPTPRFIARLGDDPNKPAYNAIMTPTGRKNFKHSDRWEAQKTLTAGAKYLFHPKGLNAEVTFVVEGEIDCASILYAIKHGRRFGGNDYSIKQLKVDAVALGGAKQFGDLLKRVRQFPYRHFVILFDNDDAGRTHATELWQELADIETVAVKKFFDDFIDPDGKKFFADKGKKIDANELLQLCGPEFLRDVLGRIVASAKADFPQAKAEMEALKIYREEQSVSDGAEISERLIQGFHRRSSSGTSGASATRGSSPELDEIKAAINRITPEQLEAAGYLQHSVNGGPKPNGYICPFCGSGTKVNKSGALKVEAVGDATLMHCFSCGNGSNVLTFLAHVWNYPVPTTGKAYFDLLKRAIDEFHLPFDSHVLDSKPSRASKADDNARLAAKEALTELPDEMQEQLAYWQEMNGEIDPTVVGKLVDAVKLIEGITDENFTVDTVYSLRVHRALALCKCYGFEKIVAGFYAALTVAKENAAAQVREAKVADGLTAKTTADVQALKAVKKADLELSVNKFVKSIQREHKNYRAAEDKKRQREEHERQRAELDEKQKAELAQLDELIKQPASAARDEEISALIRERCEWRCNQQRVPVAIKTTAANSNIIFTYDQQISGVVGFDEFQQADVFLKRPSWRKSGQCVGETFKDRDESLLRFYLRETYAEFGDTQTVRDAINKYSDMNSFHPVKAYFSSLPKWDGTPRAEEIFIKFLGVKDTPFAREVTMNWLTAAVARIYFPGCPYQNALVLHGKQGIGKSYILMRLGGQWYNTINDNVDDPHAVDAIQNTWIGEFKEMKGMRKADVNAIKAFIDTAEDNRRASFERRAGKTKRHIVFGLTVNDPDFLRDQTGNRRFPILECLNPAGTYVEGLTDEYISQVWAEVKAKFDEMFDAEDDLVTVGKKLELSRETKRLVDEIAQTFTFDDGLRTDILGFVDTPIPPQIIWKQLTREERRDFIKTGCLQLYDGGGGLIRRLKARRGRNVNRDVDLLEEALRDNNVVRREENSIAIYGTEYRQHICATEIFNECSGVDNRKKMYRINEVLSQLDGWALGERAKMRGVDPAYPDQSKPYFRNEDNNPTNEPDDGTHTNDNDQSADQHQNSDETHTADSTQSSDTSPAQVDFFPDEPCTDTLTGEPLFDDPPF